jgi:putative transposase
VLLNPVKAKIAGKPWDYKWSSVKHHIGADSNPLVKDDLLQELIVDWEHFLATAPDSDDIRLFQTHERTGRPLGGNAFIEKLEHLLNIDLKKKKPGRRKKSK